MAECAVPTGLGYLVYAIPTAEAVGYDLSSLTGLAERTSAIRRSTDDFAFGCGYAALSDTAEDSFHVLYINSSAGGARCETVLYFLVADPL
jgi:hypothetical protein